MSRSTNPNKLRRYIKWPTKYWSARIAELNSHLPKENRNLHGKGFENEPQRCFDFAEQENFRETTEALADMVKMVIKRRAIAL